MKVYHRKPKTGKLTKAQAFRADIERTAAERLAEGIHESALRAGRLDWLDRVPLLILASTPRDESLHLEGLCRPHGQRNCVCGGSY